MVDAVRERSCLNSNGWYALGTVLRGVSETSNIASKFILGVEFVTLSGSHLNFTTKKASPEALAVGLGLHLFALAAKEMSASAFAQSNCLSKAKIEKVNLPR